MGLSRANSKKNDPLDGTQQRKSVSFGKKIVKGVVITGTIFTLLLSTGGAVSGAIVWDKYGDFIQSSVTKGYSISEHIKEEDFITKSPTKIYDSNGKLLKVFKEYQYETPKFKEINPFFVEALVSAEDERFYDHHGVDLYGTMRGILTTLKGNGTQGGSTITQQLVRNVILNDNNVSVERKLVEQVVAQELEKKMDKNEILRHYLNNVYFGNGNYGIAPSATYYFSKKQSEIELHEAALIIGITNNPSLFDPIRNPENALKKRNRVLMKMWENDAITEKQYKNAIAKPLGIKVQKHKIDNSVTEPALGYAIHKATEHMMEKNGFIFQYVFTDEPSRTAYQERYHESYVKTREDILKGGYLIETSIDVDKQTALKRTVEKVMSPYTLKDRKTGFYQLQTAITTIDNRTGEVVAIIGGRNDKGNYFNRSYQGVRQPGSTIKPIVAYTPAFEIGYSPESVMADRPIKNGPGNYYNGYRGMVTLRYATEISINTVPYQLANKLGGDKMIEKLSDMQFSHLSSEDRNPIISVGGFTYGTTTVEMASAYESLINHGEYREPTNIRKIKDIVTGETLYEHRQKVKKVYDSGAAYLMVDTLKGVMSKGTGTRAMPSNYKYTMGKTGTTNADKDIWFVGGTPYFSTAVWTGYDTPSSMPASQHWVASSLFKEWNEQLHHKKKVIDFARPDTVFKQNGRWVAKSNQTEQMRNKRKQQEEWRKENERLAQSQRLDAEDYRIIHGLTKSEELEWERLVRERFQAFYDEPFDDLDEYEHQMTMLEDILPFIEEVKHKKAFDSFMIEWNDASAALNRKRQSLIDEIKRKEEEKKRLALEKAEAERLEEERRIQEEVERRLEEERQAQAESEAQDEEDAQEDEKPIEDSDSPDEVEAEEDEPIESIVESE